MHSSVHFLYARVCVCVCDMLAHTFMHVQRGSVVPAVLLFGTARRVNPGQCVVKKPYVRRGCHTSVRATKREETRRERREEARGMARKGGGKEGDANVHGALHARTHTRWKMHSRCGRPSNARVRCQTRLRLLVAVRSLSNASEFYARCEFSIFFS